MSWFTRLKNALNPHRLDDDLADEMRDHLARRSADLQRRGLTPSEAGRQSNIAFGNRTQLQERSREIKLWSSLDTTLQDIRYSWRGLLRSPMFALTAILSLGLAIGANTAIYSIVDALILRPLPVPEPERLFSLAAASTTDMPGSSDTDGFSFPLYQQLSATLGTSDPLALFDTPSRVEAQGSGGAAPYEELVQQFVSPNAFTTLSVRPAAGALFSPQEDSLLSPRKVVVLSHDYWKRRFSADPNAVGQTLIVRGMPLSIIGVTMEGFKGAEAGRFVDIWLPVTLADPGLFGNPSFNAFRLLGRLSHGTTIQQIEARLQPVFRNHQASRIEPGMPAGIQQQLRQATLTAQSAERGTSPVRQMFSRPLWILMIIAACILTVACANVAGLLISRSTARAAEIALRVSLGARRARLVRQLLTESLLIASLAGLLGWALADIAAPILVSMVSKPSDPVKLDLALDGHVLLFCALVCLLSTVGFGLLPALQATASRPMAGLRHAGIQASRLRLGNLFVGLQVAFAFCLIITGSGFLFSLRNLAKVDTGFNPRNVAVLTISNSPRRESQLQLMRQLQSQVSVQAGVQGAAAGWMPIFSGARRAEHVLLPGRRPSDREETFYRISPNYFSTLQTPLLQGRDFDDRDNDNEPVATVVNQAFERRYFEGRSALGREFRRASDGAVHRIIGIAADSRFTGLRGAPEAIAYMPMKPPLGFTLYVRSGLDIASVAKLVDRETKALGKGMRVRDVTSVEMLIGTTLVRERLLASIGGVLAALGLVLTATGLFGQLSYSVSRRTREIGVRVALGAPRLPIASLVLGDVIRLIIVGLSAGLVGAIAVMRMAGSLLFGVGSIDPVVIGVATVVFLATTVLACGIPVFRASSIDPMVALRHE